MDVCRGAGRIDTCIWASYIAAAANRARAGDQTGDTPQPTEETKKDAVPTDGAPAVRHRGQYAHVFRAPHCLRLGKLDLRVVKGPSRPPRDDKQYKYLTVENWFNYPDLKDYYGPLNIVQIIQFVDLVKMQIAQNPERTVCLVARSESQQSLNALLLAAAYLMLAQELHPKEAAMRIHPILRELQVATHYKTEGEPQDNDLHITILDCLQGLRAFTTAGLLNLDTIDVKEYVRGRPDPRLIFVGP